MRAYYNKNFRRLPRRLDAGFWLCFSRYPGMAKTGTGQIRASLFFSSLPHPALFWPASRSKRLRPDITRQFEKPAIF